MLRIMLLTIRSIVKDKKIDTYTVGHGHVNSEWLINKFMYQGLSL